MRLSRRENLVTVLTPAKVNLFLEVLARRPDGFHELDTLLATIDWCDTLEFRSTVEPEIDFACRWGAGCEAWGQSLRATTPESDLFGPLPAREENLAWRSVQLFRQRAQISAGAVVRLWKRIPAAAGLGGASADAAAALLAANEGWNVHWPAEKLAELAAELGSDVPFFLYGPRAICQGRGERVAPQQGRWRLPVVVLRPPVGLSTPRVFGRCRPADVPQSSATVAAALETGNPAACREVLLNRLEPAARELSPWVARVQQELKSSGAVASAMSGSGSSCFAVGRTFRHARRLAARLRTMSWGAVAACRLPGP
jgi:4-diphosphocytidyl-2-C-methyl-D-erythritol kinase